MMTAKTDIEEGNLCLDVRKSSLGLSQFSVENGAGFFMRLHERVALFANRRCFRQNIRLFARKLHAAL